MNAIFKNKNKLVVTGCDNDERIIIKDFIENAKNKEVDFQELVDINGDQTGVAIEIKDSEE